MSGNTEYRWSREIPTCSNYVEIGFPTMITVFRILPPPHPSGLESELESGLDRFHSYWHLAGPKPALRLSAAQCAALRSATGCCFHIGLHSFWTWRQKILMQPESNLRGQWTKNLRIKGAVQEIFWGFRYEPFY